MPLQTRLDRIREGFEKQVPPEALAIIHRATDDLRASGIMDNVVGEGQKAPGFALQDSQGRPTALADALSAGPVVLTFYRGDW
jgi:hypothetical protein